MMMTLICLETWVLVKDDCVVILAVELSKFGKDHVIL